MMRTLMILSILFLSLASASGQEDYAKEKEEFQRWANKLYFAFGKKADTNADRYLSVKELRDFCDRELEASASSKNELTLRIMRSRNPKADLDGDGILTKAELLSYLDKFLEQEGDV